MSCDPQPLSPLSGQYITVGLCFSPFVDHWYLFCGHAHTLHQNNILHDAPALYLFLLFSDVVAFSFRSEKTVECYWLFVSG